MEQNIRTDKSGFTATALVSTLIAVLVVVLMGLILLSVILTQVGVYNDTFTYGTTIPTLVDLIPIFWVLGLAIAALAIVFIAVRQAM